MSLSTQQLGAAALVLVLGLAIAVGLAPYATGLIGIPVLYVTLRPPYAWLAQRAGEQAAATLVVALTLLVLVVAGGALTALTLKEAQQVASTITGSALLARLSELKIGNVALGAQIGDLSSKLVSWLGSSAFGFIGSASRVALNLSVALIGLFYLLPRPERTWDLVRPYIPFSERNVDQLRQRFRDVTASTLIGTGLSAATHGTLVSLGFWVAGLPNAAFWGVVTMVFSILPVLGSGMIWGPAAVVLLIQQRPVAAVLLALWGLVVVGNVDYVIRPMVSRRWAHIHPLVTLLGALVGVPYFGLLGLLIGPLALSYFFLLIAMYREEYVKPS